MSDKVQALLSVLDSVRDALKKLTEIEQRKMKAVSSNDLLALDDIMKAEQAMALNLRGLDQKRSRALSDLGFKDAPLSKLPEICPPEMKDEAKRAVNELKAQYSEYRNFADRARIMLEDGINGIEDYLSALGVVPSERGAGYEAENDMSPPKSMKTDFRA